MKKQCKPGDSLKRNSESCISENRFFLMLKTRKLASGRHLSSLRRNSFMAPPDFTNPSFHFYQIRLHHMQPRVKSTEFVQRKKNVKLNGSLD